jgi:hypothetical protein
VAGQQAKAIVSLEIGEGNKRKRDFGGFKEKVECSSLSKLGITTRLGLSRSKANTRFFVLEYC